MINQQREIACAYRERKTLPGQGASVAHWYASDLPKKSIHGQIELPNQNKWASCVNEVGFYFPSYRTNQCKGNWMSLATVSGM
jgi:hypothetical protein